MCLIAARPAGRNGGNITDRIIEHNLRINDDGYGIAWRDRGRLLHEKFGPSDSQPFRDLLEDIDATEQEYIAHWRMATTGKPCKELSHPFKYKDKREGEVLVFHNGIIPVKADAGESDTSHFVKHCLTKMQARWWDDKLFRWMVEQSIGYSRLAIMTVNKTIRLGDGWKKIDDIWYSTSPAPATSALHTGYRAASIESYSEWLDKDDDDDEEIEGTLLLAPGGSKPVPESGWPDKGHWVTALTQEGEPSSTERHGAAVCESCKTMGEYYVIDGQTYIDVAHGQIAIGGN